MERREQPDRSALKDCPRQPEQLESPDPRDAPEQPDSWDSPEQPDPLDRMGVLDHGAERVPQVLPDSTRKQVRLDPRARLDPWARLGLLVQSTIQEQVVLEEILAVRVQQEARVPEVSRAFVDSQDQAG